MLHLCVNDLLQIHGSWYFFPGAGRSLLNFYTGFFTSFFYGAWYSKDTFSPHTLHFISGDINHLLCVSFGALAPLLIGLSIGAINVSEFTEGVTILCLALSHFTLRAPLRTTVLAHHCLVHIFYL